DSHSSALHIVVLRPHQGGGLAGDGERDNGADLGGGGIDYGRRYAVEEYAGARERGRDFAVGIELRGGERGRSQVGAEDGDDLAGCRSECENAAVGVVHLEVG